MQFQLVEVSEDKIMSQQKNLYSQPMESLLGGGGGDSKMPSIEELMAMSEDDLMQQHPEAIKAMMQFAQNNAASQESHNRTRKASQEDYDRSVGMGGSPYANPNAAVDLMKSTSVDSTGDLANMMAMIGKRENKPRPAGQSPQVNKYIMSLLGV
jgi:hypothetical protein